MNKQNKRHRWIRKFKDGTNFPGQHFMHRGLAKRLVEMAKIKPEDLVLDIGAGTGALTLPLADKAGKVLAIENDPVLAEKLQRKVAEKHNVTVIQQSILDMRLPRRPFCVVSSIPYSITTPILRKLLDQPGPAFQWAVLVVEKGAAKRFTAVPVTDPRIMTWRMWFHIERGRTIPPQHFSPPPDVESSVLTVRRRHEPGVSLRHRARFAALAAYCLKDPERPMDEALKGVFTPRQIKRLVKQLKIDRYAPIYSLSERQWEFVFHTMRQFVEPYRWPK